MRLIFAIILSLIVVCTLGACGDNPPQSGDVSAAVDTSGVAPDTATPPSCTADSDCDDGLSCTTDTCTPGQGCSWKLSETSCLVNNVCYEQGETKVCEICEPSVSNTSLSQAPNATACDDGDSCTEEGKCINGTCATAPINCDDGLPCTKDTCGPEGCTHTPDATGEACDDNNACTVDTVCADGACTGKAITCDDDDPCTTDGCDPVTGCTTTAFEGPCDDGDACTEAGNCVGGICEAGAPIDCDDGNGCTLDTCAANVGCNHVAVFSPCCSGMVSVCDDDNPCTDDACDPDTAECSYELNKAGCDDGDACTEADTCSGGTCAGNAITCDDGNPCTDDACDANQGCVGIPNNSTDCTDGLECSVNDTCQNGVCVGDTTNCSCVPEFSDVASKVTDLALGLAGHPGDGLDLDGNANTCAPEDDCSGGIDNSFATLATLAEEIAGVNINQQMSDTAQTGGIKLVIEVIGYGTENPQLALYQTGLDPSNPGCDFQKDVCSYWAEPEFLDAETCQPTVLLPATIEGNKVVAGGPGNALPFDMPFEGGISLNIVLYDIKLEGSIIIQDGNVYTMSAVLGAAILKEDFENAILALPADALGGLEPDTVLPLLSLAIEYDMVIPGKGQGASIGYTIKGIGAKLTGVKP